MVLLAANEPGGTEGYTWTKTGDAGAIEVPPRLAHALLSIPGELYYVVQKDVKKAEKIVKAVETVVAKVEEEVEKVLHIQAEETPAAPKAASKSKRTTKE
jgi:hypothetical protein